MKISPAKQRLLATALAGASLLGVAGNASAAGVTMTDISDVFGLFGASTSAFDTSTNTLTLTPTKNVYPAIHGTAFTAYSFQGHGNFAGPLGIAFDTFTVTFKADPGYKITDLTYGESGAFFRQGTGAVTYVSGSMSVNGSGAQGFTEFPTFVNGAGTKAGAWRIDPITVSVNGDSATVVVSDVLAALSGANDFAFITKALAKVKVDVTAVPLPPALWMLGSALVGLVTVGRRGADR